MNEESRGSTPAPRLSVIVAVAKNGVIGAGNRIPWHLPAELKIFKDVTMGHHIVMGRRTWESINRLLPGRTSIVVTRQRDYTVPGAIMAHSLDEALAAASADNEVFVIGGAALFEEALPRADRLHRTVVDTAPEGDTFMPDVDWKQWHATAVRDYPSDDRNPLPFRYTVYDRVRG